MAAKRDIGFDAVDFHRRYASGETTVKEEADRLGVDRKLVSKRYHRWLKRGGMDAPTRPQPLAKRDKVSVSGLVGGGQTIESPKSSRIRTLDDLIEACAIDLAVWTIEKHVINKWEVGAKDPDTGEVIVEPLFQVKAWLVPRKDIVNAREIIAAQIEEMRRHSPVYKLTGRGSLPTGEHLLEIAVADPHLGMYAWADETGEGYNLATAEGIVPAAVEQLAQRATAAYGVREILLYVGGDILHVDTTIKGAGGSTSKGTPQDVSGRWPEIFQAARRSLVASIDALQARAPVTVIVKAGNHDEQSAFALGEALDAWYRLSDRVTVLNSPEPYTYWRWGRVLLGFTHGHLAKMDRLPTIMATGSPAEDWVASEAGWREWHVGHTHAAKVVDRVLLDEDRRIRMRVVPSLAAQDGWHTRMGYAHRRAAEAYVWHKTDGFVGMLNVSAADLRNEEAA